MSLVLSVVLSLLLVVIYAVQSVVVRRIASGFRDTADSGSVNELEVRGNALDIAVEPRKASMISKTDPGVAVVLSVRGLDPFFEDSLKRLADQDYRNHTVFVAFDNENDPAAIEFDRILGDLESETDVRLRERFQKIIVKNPTGRCSLLNHNYVSVIRDLDESIDFVVIVDSDVLVWRTWLRELLDPMIKDASIGASSGNRWYNPREKNLGSIMRSVWNLGSVVQMAMHSLPWGGSLAIRREIAQSQQMLEHWENSFCEDATCLRIVQSFGKRHFFNPRIMVHNPETITVGSFCKWMCRQLMIGRLYHDCWTEILLHGVIGSILLIFTICFNLFNLITGNWLPFAILGSISTLYWLGMFDLFLRTDSRVACRNGTGGAPRSWKERGMILISIPILQVLYLYAVLRAASMRTVDWRGIRYRVNAPFQIEMEQYDIYRPKHLSTTHSI